MHRIFLFAALWLALPAPLARAQADGAESRARELWENGRILYEEGRYEDAIVAWEEGWRLSDRPAFLFNIASAQERVGLWSDALNTLNRYRAYASAEERSALDRRIANIERRLAEEPRSTPEPVETALPKAQTQRESISDGWLPLTLSGVGAASLATGAVFGVHARTLGEQVEIRCVEAGSGMLCPSSAGDLLSSEQRSARIADIAFGLGTIGLGSGVTVLVVRSRRSSVGVGPGSLTWSIPL